MFYLGLCAIAKDETSFLREWVAYHHYIGFERIYLYDNESAVPLRDTVSEFYERGICDPYTLPGKAMQLVAYNHCLKHHGHEFEWLAFFDLDEFLCLKQDRDARALMRDYEAYSGLSVNWDMFGSSGFLGRPQGLVMQNYRQSLGYTVNSKCIVRPARVKMPLSPHHFIFHEGISVNADKRPAIGAYAPLAVDRICLNHYSIRSQQDYEEKIRRGDAIYEESNPRSVLAFYAQAAQPAVERESILPIAAEVERMLSHPPPKAKYAVSYAEVTQCPLPSLIKNITLLIKNNQKDWAEVLFALGGDLWKNSPEFLNVGIALFRQLEKYDRALSLARDLVALTPEKEAYFTLLECLTAAGEREEAVSVGDFLEEFALLDSKSEFGGKVRQYRAAQNI
jgi:hypothetical protein